MLLHLPVTTSTMEIAAQCVRQSDTTTQIVLADAQTAGRGRHHRPWLTFPAPHGLAVTYIVRPVPGPHLPLLVALALFQTLQQTAPNITGLSIKWPNDILLNGQKLAGILCETLPSPLGQPVALVGVGLNLTRPPVVPETFQGTFLSQTGPSDVPTPLQMAQNLHTCLLQTLDLYKAQGWSDQLHQNYLQACSTMGQQVTWQRGTPQQIHGLARSLTPSGALELVAEDNTVHLIHSGEIMAENRPA